MRLPDGKDGIEAMTSSVLMVAVECTCLAFLLVILAAYIVLPRSVSLKKDRFFPCLLVLILGLSFDAISWICECVPSASWLQYSSNTLCLVASGFLNSFFAYYIISIIREKKPVSWILARVISIVNICGAAFVVIAAFCGTLFDVVPYPSKPEIMVYNAAGLAYDIPNYLSSLSLIVLFAFVLHNAKALGRNKIIVFSIYFLLPMMSAGLELVSENLQFSYAVTSVCMSVIYVMLQSNHINELMIREEVLNEWSYKDSLTNLLNRRAFERTLEDASGDDFVCVAFCDLNGLKKVNDEKGHQAGDRYLISFSEMLTRHFSHDCVYRISGDEFVVVARGISNEEFDSRIKGLKEEIDANSSIASLGTICGRGNDISRLVKDAEEKMYADKEKFYLMNPGYRRRSTDR